MARSVGCRPPRPAHSFADTPVHAYELRRHESEQRGRGASSMSSDPHTCLQRTCSLDSHPAIQPAPRKGIRERYFIASLVSSAYSEIIPSHSTARSSLPSRNAACNSLCQNASRSSAMFSRTYLVIDIVWARGMGWCYGCFYGLRRVERGRDGVSVSAAPHPLLGRLRGTCAPHVKGPLARRTAGRAELPEFPEEPPGNSRDRAVSRRRPSLPTLLQFAAPDRRKHRSHR